MSSYNSNKILNFFIKNFDLNKYKATIQTEGYSSLTLLTKKKLFKINHKLNIFIKYNWLSNFIKIKYKLKYLQVFNKCYENKNFDTARNEANKLNKKILYNSISSPIINIKQKTRGSSKGKTIPDRLKKLSIKNKSKYHKKFWLSIGINDYQYFPKLKNAVNDAIELTKFAKEKLGFNTFKLINESATKQHIEYLIKNTLFNTSSKNDLIVISFHGHGETIIIDGVEHGFIVPYKDSSDKTPAELISMKDFSNWVQYLKANHVLLLFDCCFSGFSALRSNKIINSKFNITSINQMLERKSRIVINAGTESQETTDGGWGNNSVFTGVILSFPYYEMFLGSVINLYNYILETVPKYTNNQIPTIGKLVGDQGGDIFLGL